MTKEFYQDTLIPELIRYAKLRRMNPEALDECGAAVYSIWYTQNAVHTPSREEFRSGRAPADSEPVVTTKASARRLCANVCLGTTSARVPRRTPEKFRGIRFTVHTHPQEPLAPSPDDLLVYHRLDAEHSDRDSVHFIADGFLCRKVDLSENE